MRLGSLFDGIGGWLLAAQRNGITPVWASEVAPFQIEVTRRHFPDVTHLGDVTGIDGAKIEPVDIITAGTPCQDLSIAGLRKGLSGERSGLFRQAIRVFREMRAATGGRRPRFFIFENVTGAYSSNKGRDFCAVLEAITEAHIPMPNSGKWANAGMVRGRGFSVCWRTLDAQYWGIPQRRKRIFLIGDFGDNPQPEIFFEPESLSGNPETCCIQRGRTAQGFDENIVQSIRERNGCKGGGKGLLYSHEKALTLTTGNDLIIYDDGRLRRLTPLEY